METLTRQQKDNIRARRNPFSGTGEFARRIPGAVAVASIIGAVGFFGCWTIAKASKDLATPTRAAISSLVIRSEQSAIEVTSGWILVVVGVFALGVSGYFLMIHWDAIVDACSPAVSMPTARTTDTG